ncbi:MAG: hypothetical protein VYD05_05955 [Planctomycetota bacterium]|nr:hypothetical protein [Planctomycetota bacterium]
MAPANPVRLSFPFALADNPFLINGPLHVRVYHSDERVILEDYLGAATSLGRFTLAFGLPAGRYRVVARSIWNALGEADITVTDGKRTEQSVRLDR